MASEVGRLYRSQLDYLITRAPVPGAAGLWYALTAPERRAVPTPSAVARAIGRHASTVRRAWPQVLEAIEAVEARNAGQWFPLGWAPLRALVADGRQGWSSARVALWLLPRLHATRHAQRPSMVATNDAMVRALGIGRSALTAALRRLQSGGLIILATVRKYRRIKPLGLLLSQVDAARAERDRKARRTGPPYFVRNKKTPSRGRARGDSHRFDAGITGNWQRQQANHESGPHWDALRDAELALARHDGDAVGEALERATALGTVQGWFGARLEGLRKRFSRI